MEIFLVADVVIGSFIKCTECNGNDITILHRHYNDDVVLNCINVEFCFGLQQFTMAWLTLKYNIKCWVECWSAPIATSPVVEVVVPHHHHQRPNRKAHIIWVGWVCSHAFCCYFYVLHSLALVRALLAAAYVCRLLFSFPIYN